MPTYVYKAVNKGCEYCKDGFELNQRFEDKALAKCPKCGSQVKRIPTSFAFFMK